MGYDGQELAVGVGKGKPVGVPTGDSDVARTDEGETDDTAVAKRMTDEGRATDVAVDILLVNNETTDCIAIGEVEAEAANSEVDTEDVAMGEGRTPTDEGTTI